MRYETRNNLGFLLAGLGSLILILALLFFDLGSLRSVIGLGGGAAVALTGFYLMTRGFTPADRDHPDYPRWHPDDESTPPQE